MHTRAHARTHARIYIPTYSHKPLCINIHSSEPWQTRLRLFIYYLLWRKQSDVITIFSSNVYIDILGMYPERVITKPPIAPCGSPKTTGRGTKCISHSEDWAIASVHSAVAMDHNITRLGKVGCYWDFAPYRRSFLPSSNLNAITFQMSGGTQRELQNV